MAVAVDLVRVRRVMPLARAVVEEAAAAPVVWLRKPVVWELVVEGWALVQVVSKQLAVANWD